MRRPNRTAIKPTVESMEARSLMAAGHPAASVIYPVIGVDGPSGTFQVDPSIDAPLDIYVLSQRGRTSFRPLTQINRGTIEVDGMSFPGAQVTRDPIDENGDGIPDAIVSIPRSSLPLTPGVNTLTFTAVDRLGSARRPVVIVAAAAIFVVNPGEGEGQGGGSGGSGGDAGGGGGSGGGGGQGGAGGVTNAYVNGYVTIYNTTRNTYLYTVTDASPAGGLPPVGTTANLYPGTPVTINTGPGFFGPSFVIKVAITVPGQDRLPPATFGYRVLSTSPNVVSQFNLILNNKNQLVFERV